MSNEELAQLAYEAYAGALGINDTPDWRPKTWSELPDERRQAWREVAAALAERSR
jgi:hypothetical protein